MPSMCRTGLLVVAAALVACSHGHTYSSAADLALVLKNAGVACSNAIDAGADATSSPAKIGHIACPATGPGAAPEVIEYRDSATAQLGAQAYCQSGTTTLVVLDRFLMTFPIPGHQDTSPVTDAVGGQVFAC